ncbi:MAG: polysaccharide deacetylase [Clostridiales bacterium]|nr:polysaccharide deacetylase [Clostridiales bacterium]
MNKLFGENVKLMRTVIVVLLVLTLAVPGGLVIYGSHLLQQKDRSLQETAGLLEQAEGKLETAEGKLQTAETKLKEQETINQQLNEELQKKVDIEEGRVRGESPYAHLYPDFYAPKNDKIAYRETGVMYLTFDDGPSARTEEVLNILKEKNVQATFFVLRGQGTYNKAMLQRMTEEGHTIGMHSSSHNYKKIYASVEAFLGDMYQNYLDIKNATGTAPTLFRFPGGSINAYNSGIYQEITAEMLRRGFIPFDWNISSQDAAAYGPKDAETLAANVLNGAEGLSYGVVLMHDAGDKVTTVEALPAMIDGLAEKGWKFKALTPQVLPVVFNYR